MITTVSEAMYEFRTRLGLSQEEVAEAVGISRVTYTRYENGTHKPDAYAAVKIAHLFGVPIEYLLCMELPEQDEEIATLTISARHLNEAGRKQLDQYVKFLLSQPEYKKEPLEAAI